MCMFLTVFFYHLVSSLYVPMKQLLVFKYYVYQTPEVQQDLTKSHHNSQQPNKHFYMPPDGVVLLYKSIYIIQCG